ncbi:MAG TPA: aldehyde dehydrogenase family protein [Sandaracinaceae bacterium LLY-WYZ-13_1]|nr:aldehyde dehydrogenase family protein [Sandaracinaceae bacterium LLY-WYZ-13_1]
MTALKTISPVDGRVYVERELASAKELDTKLAAASRAQRAWRGVPRERRAEALGAFVDRVVADSERIADELTWQMGRPRGAAPGEVSGFEERARAMIHLGLEALPDLAMPDEAGFDRFIRREPLGVVLVLAPWNYPWLTAVNAVVPALMAGNAVLLKHSDQTPLVSERMVEHALAADVPEGLFDYLHMSHERVAEAVADPRVDFVAFTGSVEGGRAVHRAAAERFIHVGLELGGKDPAYVRPDVDVAAAAEGLVDGAYFNSGQSCCGIERIYVHRDVYDPFVEAMVAGVEALRLGDPTDETTTLGPVVRVSNAKRIQAQLDAALAAGATARVDASRFEAAAERGLPYLAPQLLTDVTHEMEIMREETFGPVVGVMPVADDEEALRWMNDSRYGLTASIWTKDLGAAARLGDRIETGTVFANRCDYLDPELAWVGIKDSGNGCTLSRIGYEHLTRPKSFHLKTP